MSGSAPDAFFAQRPWLLALVLAVVTFAAYQPAWHAGFIWDDDDHLTANPAMTAPEGLRMIWSSLAVSRYYPLTLTSFWIQRQCWGLNPMPYHLVNIALHAINGILVFLVLRRLRVPAALLAAAVWVLHPVNVESVAWVTELKNTQSGAFFLLAVLCFLRFEDGAGRRWYALAFLCGLAAMLSKPSTVVLPLVLLLCALWERKRWGWMDLARSAPFFGLALGMSALTIIEQRGRIVRAGATDWALGMAGRLTIASKAVWFYAAKLLWPVSLTFVYPRWRVLADSPSSWVPLAGLIAVGLLLWIRRRQYWARAAMCGIGFFIIALLPVLGFFDIFYFQYSFVADHFQYLACIGLIALVVNAGVAIFELAGQWGRDWGMVAASIVLLMLGVFTWRQTRIYHDSETLWRDTLYKNSNAWMAHNNLGLTLQNSGRINEALEQYEQSLQIKPRNVTAYYNMGNALVQAGRLHDAVERYEQALRIEPDSAEAHNNLGITLGQLGQIQQAMGHFEQSVQIKPDSAEAHYNLGIALVQLGRTQEALEQWEQVVRIDPDHAEAHYDLGVALERLGRPGEAIVHYEDALRINPDYADAQRRLERLRTPHESRE